MPLIADRFTPLRPLGPHLLLVQDRDATPRVLKRLPESRQGDPAAVLRFKLEAWRAAQLAGPRFVSAFRDEGSPQEAPFYTMGYAEGTPATHVPPHELMPLVRELAEALVALHAHGWVHAGLEPAKLRRTDAGLVLTGYGNLTPIGTCCWREGERDYQAPEQAASQPLDGRADLFSVGALLHFWMTGEPHAQHLLDDNQEPLARLACRLLSPNPADRPADAAALLAALGSPVEAPPPVLVPLQLPRERVMASFEQALQSSEPYVRRIEAPAGAGKSTLLDLAAQSARAAGWPVVRTRGRGPGALPLTPWQELVTALEPIAQERHPGLADRYRMRLAPWRHSRDEGLTIPEASAVRLRYWESLAEFIGALAPPGLVILLDDWEQADEASQAAWQVVRRRLAELPVVWLVAGDRLPPTDAPPLALPPLSREEGVALVQSLLDAPVAAPDAEALHLVATGQPWFLLNFVAHLREAGLLRRDGDTWRLEAAESWPTTPEALAWLRLAPLSPAAWQVGAACALAAPQITARVLSLLLPDENVLAEGLDALLIAGVLHEQEHGFCFTHPSYAGYFEESLPPDEQGVWHARLLEGESGLDPYALARHAMFANRPEALAILSLNAARLVLARGAFGEARRLLEEGLVTLGAEHGARASYLLALAEVDRLEGDDATAQALYSEALDVLTSTPERMVAQAGLAHVATRLGQHAEARDRWRQVVALAQAQGDLNALTGALVGLTEALAALGELQDAVVSGETALGTASDASPLPRAGAMAALGALLAAGGRERQQEGVALLQRATALYEAEGDKQGLMRTLQRLAEAEWTRGELHAALADSQRALTLANELADSVAAVQALAHLALVARDLEDLALAGQSAQQARQQAEALGHTQLAAEALALEGLVRQARGEAGVGVALTSNALTLLPLEAPLAVRARLALWLAEAHLAENLLPEAAGALNQAKSWLDEARRPELAARRAWLLGRWAARMGDRERARQEFKAVLGAPNQWLVSRAALDLGKLALDVGNQVEAAGWLEQARRGAETLGVEPLAQEAGSLERALLAPVPETPQGLAQRVTALLQEAQGLLPRLVAPASSAQELERQVAELKAQNTLWQALFVATSDGEVALAMTRAAFQGSEAERVFVLGKTLEAVASRTREGGELPFSPAYIDAALCRQALETGRATVAEGAIALPLPERGVLYATGVGPEAEPLLTAIVQAALLALDRLDREENS